MAKIIRSQRAGTSSVRSAPKKKVAKAAKPLSKGTAKKAPAKKAARKAAKPKPWTAEEVYEAFDRFRKANPEPKGELEHLNPYTPEKMLELGEEKVRDYIKTIGLYRNKAKNVIALSEKLIAEFGGEVPRTRAEIESLPGAGRKTANVVLNMAFGERTMAVDTHVFRVGNRTGLAPGKTPLEVELGLEKVIPTEFMLHAHHWLILHGRYTCLARGPRCEVCLINDLCRWPEKTV